MSIIKRCGTLLIAFIMVSSILTSIVFGALGGGTEESGSGEAGGAASIALDLTKDNGATCAIGPNYIACEAKKKTNLNTPSVGGTCESGAKIGISSDSNTINLNGNADINSPVASAVVSGNQEATYNEKEINIVHADIVKINGNTEAKAVEDGTIYSNGNYQFGHVDYIRTPTTTVVDGYNVVSNGNIFSVGTGNTISQTNTAVSSTVTGFNSNGNTFSVDSAKVVVIDNHIFPDIGQSTFTTDNSNHLIDVTITSAIDNNTFELNDAQIIVDSGESFHATFNLEGDMNIDTASRINITKDDETIVTLTNIIDPARKILNNTITTTEQVGKSTVEIDSDLGVVAVHLAPTSRYILYTNTTNSKPFSLYAVPEHSFDFYLKKHPDQKVIDIASCVQCGMIDYTKRIIYLNGFVEYERKSESTNKFVDIVQSKSGDSRAILNLDNNMDKITSVTYSGTLAQFYSGVFELAV
jgi:hypothetical protein